jgi:anti-sigma28 factor (negative regulator of flagellin synthesis)
MKTNEIVKEIAHLVAQRELSLKNPKETKELKSKQGISPPQDHVSFTSTAQAYTNAGAATSEYEREQNMKVERLKSLVGGGNYKMDEQVVSSIAERIANMLV